MFVRRMSRLIRVGRLAGVAWLLASLALPTAATPVVSSPDSLAPLPLRQAVRSAWEAHPQSRQTEAILAAAQARLEAARRPLYNPEVDLDAEREGVDRTTTAGLSLTLDLSGKRHMRTDAATARLDQATAEARIRRRDFTRQWFASWAAVQTAQQRVLSGERRIGLVTRFADLAQKQFDAGDVSGLERDLALLARDEAEAEQSQLLGERAEAESQFRAVGGDPAAAAALALPSDGLPLPAGAVAAVEQLPDWQAASAASTVAQREIDIAKRNRIADPTVGVRGGRVDYGDQRDNVIGVSVSLPLFIRNTYRAEVVAAQADADAADAEAGRVRIALAAEQRRAIDSYTAAQAAWTRWSRSRGTDIDRRAALLEKLWREGDLSTADYLLQLKQTLDTALAGAELEARLWRAFTDYLAATGQLERWSGLEGTP
jgi:cobalt-zinc-cadmium efflux system outer membrane protein